MRNTTVLYAHMTDNELIAKAKKGSAACFEMLITRHSQALYRVGRMFGFDENSVEDLIHDVHLYAYEHLKHFDTQYSYRKWIIEYMIVECTKVYEYMDGYFNDSNPEQLNEPAGSQVITPKRLSENATNQLEHFVEGMPLQLRSVFVVNEIEGYSVEETAELLKITETAVRLRLSRAKHFLRESMTSWYQYTDIYAYTVNLIDRVINKVMSRINKHDYKFEKALMPR